MKRDTSNFDVISELGAMRRYAGALTRDPADAEDLVHDALVRAYDGRGSFRPGGSLRSWLFSILHNTHVDRRRAATAKRRGDDRQMAEAETVFPAGQEHAARLSRVRDAFALLPEEQREALHLVAVEEFSYQEAADALGIPVGTLMSRVSRARARLRAFEEGEAMRPTHLRLVGGDDE